MTTLASRALRGGGATYAGQFVRMALQVLGLAILSRLLYPDDFGLFAMVMAVVGVATVVGDFGLSLASISAGDSLSQQQRSNLFWTNVALGVLLAATVWALAPSLSTFFGREELESIAKALALLFVLNAAAVQHKSQIASDLRFTVLAIIDTSAQAVGLLAAVAIAFAGGEYWALVAQPIAVALFSLVAATLCSRWSTSLPRRGHKMRSLYRFGLDTLFVQIAVYVSNNADTIALGRAEGSATAGLYSRAYQLYSLPLQQLGAPTTKIAVATLSRLRTTPAEFSNYVIAGHKLFVYVFVVLFGLLSIYAELAITVLLGPSWQDASTALSLLALAGAVQAAGYSANWLYLATAETRRQLAIAIPGRIAFTVLVVASAYGGMQAVAAAVLAGQLLMTTLHATIGIKGLGVARSRMARVTLRPLLLMAPLVAIGALLRVVVRPDDILIWQLISVPGIVAYIGATVTLVPALRADVKWIVDISRGALRRRNPSKDS